MAWTDSIDNITKIRKVHITELRSKIDTLASISCPTNNTTNYTSYKTTVQTTQYRTVYSSNYSSYKRNVNSAYDTSTYAAIYYTHYSPVYTHYYINKSSNHSHGIKGPCYILKRLIDRWSHKYDF